MRNYRPGFNSYTQLAFLGMEDQLFSALLSLFLGIFSTLTLHIYPSVTLHLKRALCYQIFAMRSMPNLFKGKAEIRFAARRAYYY
jgi:hypothetical protein